MTKAKNISLTCPGPFSYDDETRMTAGIRWATWIKELELYMEASNIDHKPQMKAILLHVVGRAARDIYYAKANAGDDYDTVKRCLTSHFDPLINVEFEIFKFGEMRQRETESLDDFVVRLRAAAQLCRFTDIDNEIKKQVVRSCSSTKLRQSTHSRNDRYNVRSDIDEITNRRSFSKSNEVI